MTLRVTFIAPHQRAASGGAPEMMSFAQHLVSRATVTLVVLGGPLTPIEGVKLRKGGMLTAADLPDADVLVVFAGLPRGERLLRLPTSKGVPVLWFAGHRAHVRENLLRIPNVLGLSPWLVDEARRYGCSASYVERPIESAVWFAGADQSERARIVSMMVHRSRAKGTEDGLDAIAAARAEVPDTEIHLFGESDDEVATFPAIQHGPLPPHDVAELLRRSSVFVWPSRREGSGLACLEALACGAALATTDTSGGRGYAIHDETALVTPPQRPDLLAQSIVSLLQDVELRRRLAANGIEHVQHSYMTWPEAAERLAAALERLAAAALVRSSIDDPDAPEHVQGDHISPAQYLTLLKRTLLGSVHQEVFGIVRRPAEFVDSETLARLEGEGLVLARRQVGLARNAQVQEGREWPLVGESMIGLKRLDNLHLALETVVRRGISGDLIEAGVWRGGATIFMRGFLAAYGLRDRQVVVADSFQGLPPPDEERYPADAGDRHHSVQALAVGLASVRANFQRYGLLDEQVEFLPGWFSDTLGRLEHRQWALIRLDGDMYGSTMEALSALYPNLSPGGFAIIDDYGAIPGAKRAVDDFRAAHGITSPLREIDWTGVFWRK